MHLISFFSCLQQYYYNTLMQMYIKKYIHTYMNYENAYARHKL